MPSCVAIVLNRSPPVDAGILGGSARHKRQEAAVDEPMSLRAFTRQRDAQGRHV